MVEAGYLFLNALWTGPLREELFVQHRYSDGQEHSDALYGPCFRPELLTYIFFFFFFLPCVGLLACTSSLKVICPQSLVSHSEVFYIR